MRLVVKLTVDVVPFVLTPSPHGGAFLEVLRRPGVVMEIYGQPRVMARGAAVTRPGQLVDLHSDWWN